MRAWPPIHDPQVLEWLALDHDAWLAMLEQRVRGFEPRAFDDAALEYALAYPWERPAGSYVLRDGEVELVEDIAPGDRQEAVASFAQDRHPLIAFGANGAPSRLEARFSGNDDPRDRTALVLTGELHDLDVGAQASPTAFGSVPAVLVASPGTAVRASVLWLTSLQLTQLTWMELGYRLGRLERAQFEMDEAGVKVDGLFAYVSRVGALRLDGGPVALAAVPASGRTAPEMTQEQLLDRMATMTIGPAAHAADLVRLCIADMPAVMERMAPLTWSDAIRLPDDHWTPYPAP